MEEERGCAAWVCVCVAGEGGELVPPYGVRPVWRVAMYLQTRERERETTCGEPRGKALADSMLLCGLCWRRRRIVRSLLVICDVLRLVNASIYTR